MKIGNMILCGMLVLALVTGCGKGSSETALYSKDIAQREVFMSADSEASLKMLYDTVDEFIESDSSDVIIKGKISEVAYVYSDECAYTISSVDVEKVYKGNVKEQISVYEDGGYTRLSDEKDSIQQHTDLSQYTEQEMENMLIEHKFMGADHPEVGDEVILFLNENPNQSVKSDYQTDCSVFGRYTLKQNEYVRAELFSGEKEPEDEEEAAANKSRMEKFETHIAKETLEEKLSH